MGRTEQPPQEPSSFQGQAPCANPSPAGAAWKMHPWSGVMVPRQFKLLKAHVTLSDPEML